MKIVEEYLHLDNKYKNKYGAKTFLLYQVGSFFEVYGLENTDLSMKNIRKFGDICDLKVEKKKQIVDNQDVYMAGFRDYMIEKYIEKIHPFGYSVVVFVQKQENGIITRNEFGVYSPGTTFLENTNKLSNNISCIWIQKSNILGNESYVFGLSNLNIYDGVSNLCEYYENYYHNPTTYDSIEKFLNVYNPIEVIFVYNIEDVQMKSIISFLNISSKKQYLININNKEHSLTKQAINCESQVYQDEIIKTFFPNSNLEIFKYNISDKPLSLQSYCFLLNFVQQHNVSFIERIQEPLIENMEKTLVCANHSLKQLNFIRNEESNSIIDMFDDDDNKSSIDSVLTILNQCKTKMGRRYMNHILLNPICDVSILNKRYDMIHHFMKKKYNFNDLLGNLKDIDKLLTKLKLMKISPSDISSLYDSSLILDKIYSKIKKDTVLCEELKHDEVSKLHHDFQKYVDTTFNMEIIEQVQSQNFEKYDEVTPFIIKQGNFPMYDEQCKSKLESRDKLESIIDYLETLFTKKKNDDNTEYIKKHQPSNSELCLICTKKRQQNMMKNIDTLKKSKETLCEIHFKSSYSGENETFVFDIEDIYFRDYNKTSVLICSQDLDILIGNIYNNNIIFHEVLRESYQKVMKHMIYKFFEHILSCVYFFKTLDMYNNFVYLAKSYNLCKPVIKNKEGDKNNTSSYVSAKKMRHILIENIDKNEIYVPNDVELGTTENNYGMLLFGTNAVGKTSLIKAIGVCTIMAQSGCYVPCKSFEYFPYKYIFTRIIGNDNIFKGLSTFGVEMSELRVILNQCNENSLILGDELCSGTEIESALSIFTASLKTMDERKSSFIFATHFHEIQDVQEIKSIHGLQMKHMKVVYNHEQDKLVYDRKLKDGAGESIYGLEVCKSLNMPDEFLKSCYEVRNNYINNRNNVLLMRVCKYNKKKIKSKCEFCKEAMASEIHHLQYQKDANENDYINDSFHKNHNANLANICEKCHQNLHNMNLVYERRKTIDGDYAMILKKRK